MEKQEAPSSPDLRARVARAQLLPWALFAAALAAAIVFLILWNGARGAEHRRTEAAASANRFLIALTNFSGETIDADVRDIRSFAVGDFADQVNTFFDQDAVTALRQAKAKSVGRIQSLFVESLSGGSATVFGVVNERVTNAANPTPRTEIVRVEVELIETKAGWKVNRVNILQSPTNTGGPLIGVSPSP